MPIIGGFIALAFWTDGYRYTAIFSTPLFHTMALSLTVTAAVFAAGTQIWIRAVSDRRRPLILASSLGGVGVFLYWFWFLALEFAAG